MARIRYWLDIYKRAFGRYSWQTVLIILLAFVSAALEGIGISAIVPVFSFVNGQGGVGNDTISHFIASIFALLHITYTFRLLVAFIAILFIARVIFIFLIKLVSARIIYGYERDLRETLFSRTLAARWPFLSQQHIGNLEQLLTTNTTNASQFFGNVSASVIVVSKILMYVGVAINMSWWVALLSLFSGIIVFFVLRPLFWRARKIAFDAEQTNRHLAHFVGEHMIGMKAIKAMALEGPVLSKGRVLFERMRTLNMRSIVLRSYVELVVQFGSVIFVGLVFAIMYRSGQFSIASFAIIVYAISQIFAQIQAGQLQLHTLTAMLPYIAESQAYLGRSEGSEEQRGGKNELSFKGGIIFKDVSFSYPTREGVLSDVSFQIKEGHLIGIIGPSGAGKTTIADLLLRLVEPTSGTIETNGNDIRDISLASWREKVGYVPQDAVLLNDSIESNITFYNSKLSHADVIAAAKSANIHTFIESLPEGYATLVGERGVMLSGGQRQRIALARVIARKPELLVLDEATSSLDTESEREIQAAIERLRGTVSVVVIAHRMSTIAHADHIVVLRDGKIEEEGTPEKLLAKKDSYFKTIIQAQPHEL
jgi:ABC-type multidrug transport system fused ATPase/permease subunit